MFSFFISTPATPPILTLSLHDALPISTAMTDASANLRIWSRCASTAQGSTARSGWPLGSSEGFPATRSRSEEHTSELQSLRHLVCRLLLEKKNLRVIREFTRIQSARAL